MDRNLLIAFTLSFLVLLTWNAMLQPSPEEQAAAERAAAEEQARAADAEPGGPTPAPADQADRFGDLPDAEPAEVLPEQARRSQPTEALPPATQLPIDRNLYDAVLTTRGGALEGWELKSYVDGYGDPVALVENGSGPGAVAHTPFLELGAGDLSREEWRVVEETPDGVAFAIERGGVHLRKAWTFDPDGYGFRLRIDVENGSSAPVQPRFLVDWPARARDDNDFKEQSFALLEDGEVERMPVNGVGNPGFFGFFTGDSGQDHYDYEGEIDWAGVESTYFVSALIPDSPAQASARVAVIERSRVGATQVFFDPVTLPPGQTLTREFRGYVGPKEADRLEAMEGGLDRSIDLGWSWVAPLTRGFNWLLQVLYSFIPNYGIAIILLTILVRVVTAPLTVKQMKSMERLRRVQPRMKEIQEKYADDKQKQSEELMRLYRQEKVNPLGGCFPMLLQLPVFIGLFYALRSSISLRQAPFFGWIDDLSAPEALFEIPGLGLPVRVLPLIMGATMFLQQKITPMQTPDPAQARMMMTVMPVMMTVLFYQFPSGLVLYWMLSNVLAIAHQLWIGRNMGPPAAPAAPAGSGSPEPKAA
ncbi:MAG: membrane protein insertase YidC [Myxococcota bacterium]